MDAKEGRYEKTAHFSIQCEACGTAYEDSEKLKATNSGELFDLLHSGDKDYLDKKLIMIIEATEGGSLKYCRKWMKCPQCGYTPSWNIQPVAHALAAMAALIFALVVTLAILAKFIIVDHIGLLAVLGWLILLLGLFSATLHLWEKLIYPLVRLFFKPNRKFPPADKKIAPKIVFQWKTSLKFGKSK